MSKNPTNPSPLPWRVYQAPPYADGSRPVPDAIMDVNGECVAKLNTEIPQAAANAALLENAVADYFFYNKKPGCIMDENNRLHHLLLKVKPFVEIGIRATVREMSAVEGVSRLAGIETNAEAWLARLGELEAILREMLELTGETVEEKA